MPDLRYQKKEHLKSLLLDTKNRVLAIKTVSVGDLSSSIVHPREVYKDAVVASAASIIVAHNHPSATRPQAPKTWPSPSASFSPAKSWALTYWTTLSSATARLFPSKSAG